MKKETVIAGIKDLPKEFSLEQIIERLIFIDKVEQGRQAVEEGRTYTHEEAKQRLKKWLE
jgi:hypothetical protein